MVTIDEKRFLVSPEQITSFCRKYHIKKLSLFGSVLRDDFRPDSDIDILVEFEEGKTPGFEIIKMQNELSQLSGHAVDLRTAKDLSRYFRSRVIREARAVYAAR